MLVFLASALCGKYEVPTLLSSAAIRADHVFEPCIFNGATATASPIPWHAFSARTAKKEEVVVCPYFRLHVLF